MKKIYIPLFLMVLTNLCHAQEKTCENRKSIQNDSTSQDQPKDVIKSPSSEKDKEPDKKTEEKPKSPHSFTGNVSFVSDYRFRGISQTMRHPAIQGGIEYSHTKGIYLGTWGSNASGATNYYNNTCLEWDFYGGYKGKLFPCSLPDLGYNIGLIYYYYPNGKAHNPQNTHYNTAEYYVELSYKWLSIKYYQTITNYFGIDSNNRPTNWSDEIADAANGNSVGSSYFEANAMFDLIDKVRFKCFDAGKLNLLLHVGQQTIRHYHHLSYMDWKVTITQEFPWLNVFISYVGTNGLNDYYNVPDNAFHPKKHDLGAQGVVFGMIKSF